MRRSARRRRPWRPTSRPWPSGQTRLAVAHGNIGLLLNELGRTAEAVTALEQGRSIYQHLADAHLNASRFQDNLAACDNNLGLLLTGAGRAADALAALHRGREVL